jgi:hypothetical protein
VDRLDDATDRDLRATEPSQRESRVSETEQIHGEVSLPAH